MDLGILRAGLWVAPGIYRRGRMSGISPAGPGAAQKAEAVSASELKANISEAAWRKGSSPSPADNQRKPLEILNHPADWDFILVLIALSVAAFALIIYCCFQRKYHPWILSRFHPSWHGWTDNRRLLPRTSFINSLQR